MKDYDHFSADDFACDRDFLRWVKYPHRDPDLDNFWAAFLRDHPHKNEQIQEARDMILATVHEDQYFPDEAQQRAVWDRISESARLSEGKRISLWSSWYSKAAAIIILLGAGWFVIPTFEKDQTPSLAEAPSSEDFVRHINNSEIPRTIILSDGTSIVLQSHSVLEYPKTFDGDIREVFLTGEGFFEVARDPSKPFLVKTGEIVTRVLGTSFLVRNIQGDNNVLVQVKTGKVSVFRTGESNGSKKRANSVEGVVLTSNQQVKYDRDEMKMTKSLVENPSLLVPVQKQNFNFADTPIMDVFAIIEQAYGVDIVFDEEALSGCSLNASLSDVPLYEKLKLICKGINATYETMDSHIIIYGRGCGENESTPKSK